MPAAGPANGAVAAPLGLSPQEARARLQALPSGWRIEGDVLVKDIAGGLLHSIALAVEIAVLADAADHHPDLSLGFDHLEVRLTTHDAGGLSTRDFDLAASIEAAVSTRPAQPTSSVAATATPAVLTVAPLPAAERAALSTTLPAWRVENDALVRAVPLSFLPAVALLNDVGALAHQYNHHPDIELAGGQLVLRTTTHDAGGLSHLDVTLAKALDALLATIAR